MPKVIKKRAAKPDASEEGLQNILGQIQEKAHERRRILLVWGGAVLAAIVLVAGFFWYRASNVRKADSYAYQGYSTLSGLYEESTAPTDKKERARKALESFTKAYELKPTAYSLYYIGICQADLGDYALAEASFGRVVAEYPNDTRLVPVALYRQGISQMSAGKNDEALRTFERFKQIGIQAMGDLAMAESARILERMGRKEESLNKYRALLLEYPGSVMTEEAKAAVAAAERAAGGGRKSGVPLGQPGFAPQLDIQPMAPPAAPLGPVLPAKK